MLKNFISIVLSTAVASLLSISAMAKDVTVNNGNTYIGTTDTLRTSSQYKTVLVVDVNANLSDLEADNIYYIDQALSETEAFVNIGLKRGENSKITEGRYTMYLVGADNNKTTRTIVVSDEPVEGEGVPFSAIAGKNGKNPVREVDGKHYIDQGYTVEFDASDTSIPKDYKLKVWNYFNSSTGITNNPFGNGNLSRSPRRSVLTLTDFCF